MEREHSSEIKEIEALIERANQLSLSTADSLTKMLPPKDCYKLSIELSSAVVVIKVWDKTSSDGGKDKPVACCTGFIISSGNDTALIMSTTSFLNLLFKNASVEKYNTDADITVTFFDPSKKVAEAVDHAALLVHVNFRHDICLLEVRNTAEKAVVVFGEIDHEGDAYLRGLPVYSVSHPVCHDILLPFVFSLGRMSQSCLPVPRERLDESCHCLLHNVPMNHGSNGAPICDYTGSLVGIHSSPHFNVMFAIGLKSIKKVLMDYFQLPANYATENANMILKAGLEKSLAKKKKAIKKKKKK